MKSILRVFFLVFCFLCSLCANSTTKEELAFIMNNFYLPLEPGGIPYVVSCASGCGKHVGKDIYALDFTVSGNCINPSNEHPGFHRQIKSIQRGEVIVVDANGSGDYGKFVEVRHAIVTIADKPGVEFHLVSKYAHMDSLEVEMGNVLRQGQTIGLMGNTGYFSSSSPCSHPGTHLHFVLYWDKYVDGVRKERIAEQPVYLSPYNYRDLHSDGSIYFSQTYDIGSADDIVTMQNCDEMYPICQDANGDGIVDDVGGDDGGSNPPPSTSLPDLQIEEITVHITPEEGDSTRLTEETSLMNPGQTYQINVWPVSKEESCQNGNTTGNEDFEVKTDVFYKYARSEDEGDWQLLKRSETHCKYMDEDDSKKEMITFIVPVDAAGKRFYVKAKVDATEDIAETDENNNNSDVEWYPIQGACDLVISSGNLTKGRLALNQGEPYGFGATVLNLGPDSCPSDTRLSYFYKKPGDADWRSADGDDTPASKLLPNQSNEEWMTEDTLVADIPGTYQARICADTNNGNRETIESNNCFDFSYTVLAIVWKPDFIVSALWIAEGTTIKSGTRVHPHCNAKNIGNATPTKDMRLAYYINSNQYRDDDNVEASEMCVGCEQHEQVNNNNIKLGDRGTRSFMCCVDYQGAVSELNEGNNCATIYFTVVK